MVDPAYLAKGIADIRDAVQRIRQVLPEDPGDFLSDRTVREVVVLNLFVALQHSLSLAAHWLADEGLDVPAGYRDLFPALADRAVLDRDLADRLAAAIGLRNLIAHRYGVIDWARIHSIARSDLGDLLAMCKRFAELASAGDG